MVFPLFARTQILNSLLPSCPFQPGITSAICPPPPLPIFLFFLFFFSSISASSTSSALPLLSAPLPPQDVHLGPCFLTYTLWWHSQDCGILVTCQGSIHVSLIRRGGRKTVAGFLGRVKQKKKKPAFYIFNHIT